MARKRGTCTVCGKENVVFNTKDGKCKACYDRLDRRKGTCVICGKENVKIYTKDGKCQFCYVKLDKKRGTCVICGKENVVFYTKDGKCQFCYDRLDKKRGTCIVCGKENIVFHTKDGKCKACYGKLDRKRGTCVICGKENVVFYTKDGKCQTCYVKLDQERGTCTACGKENVVFHTKDGKCKVCYAKLDYKQKRGTCIVCGKENVVFHTKDGKCQACYVKLDRKRGTCIVCGKENILFATKDGKCKACYMKSSASYDTYFEKLSFFSEAEELLKQGENGELIVACKYCGREMISTIRQVQSRLSGMNVTGRGESHFYCSDKCKNACPLYGKNPNELMILSSQDPKVIKQREKEYFKREVPSFLRQQCFKRDNYTCLRCGKTIDQISLHCHHIVGAKYDPVEEYDIDNTATLCSICHSKLHTLPGCSCFDLQCDVQSAYDETYFQEKIQLMKEIYNDFVILKKPMKQIKKERSIQND